MSNSHHSLAGLRDLFQALPEHSRNRFHQFRTHWSEWRHVFALYRLWRQRQRQRRQLASMSDHLLKDIGVSRYDALQEANKPFWHS